MTASIKGLKQLQRKIDRLPKVAKDLIRKAMEQSADEIVALARTLCPYDSLRATIGWTWGRAPRGSIALGRVETTGGALTITIYAGDDEVFWARWVEFGTAPHNTAKGGGTKVGKIIGSLGGGLQHPGTEAKPFFFVAYRAMRRRSRGRIARAINKSAKQVASSGGS
jgi:hypothetical protein